jgi:hypothetical protein
MKRRAIIILLSFGIIASFLLGLEWAASQVHSKPRTAKSEYKSVSGFQVKKASSIQVGDAGRSATLATNLLRDRKWDELDVLLRNWAAQAPGEALEWARNIPQPYRNEATSLVELGWFESDPNAAFAWFVVNDPRIFKDQRFYEIAARVAPEKGIAGLNTLEDRENQLYHFAKYWALSDLNAARDYVGILTEPDRVSAASAVITTWAAKDPRSAIDWATANTQPGLDRRRLYTAVIWGMAAAGEIEQAGAWLRQLPAGNRDMFGAYSAMAESVVYTDPAAAVMWMNQISDKQERSSNAILVTRLLKADRPDLAATLVLGIIDTPRGMGKLVDVLDVWSQRDVEAARYFVESNHSIPDSIRSKLLQRLAEPKRSPVQ